MKRSLILLFLSLFFLPALFWPSHASLAGEDLMRGPWEGRPAGTTPSAQQREHETPSPAASFFKLLVTFFQQVISPVDGDRCPSYPTCSTYSIQAYEQHGALLGTLMTVDRLIHEVSEHEFAPTTEIKGVARIYDPLSANEFWTKQKGKTGRRE